MKRKVYTTDRERKTDQIIGFGVSSCERHTLVCHGSAASGSCPGEPLVIALVGERAGACSSLSIPPPNGNRLHRVHWLIVHTHPARLYVRSGLLWLFKREPWGSVIGLLLFLGLAAGLFLLYCLVLATIDRRSRGE